NAIALDQPLGFSSQGALVDPAAVAEGRSIEAPECEVERDTLAQNQADFFAVLRYVCQPQAGHAATREAPNVAPGDPDATVIVGQEPAHGLGQQRLAIAGHAGDGYNLAASNPQTDVLQRMPFAPVPSLA